MPTGKKVAIIGVTAIVVIVVAGIITLDIVNRRAEEEIARSVDDSIAMSGMDDYIAHGEIDVRSARGTMSIGDVSYADPVQGVTVEAEELSFTAPQNELIAMMRDPDTATLSQATMIVRNATIAGQPGTGEITIASLDVEVTGSFSQQMGPDPISTLSSMESMSLSLDDLKITPTEEMIARFTTGGESPLSEEANWRVDTITLEAHVENNSLLLDAVDIASPLFDLGARATIALSEYTQPIPETVEITVNEIDPALRDVVRAGGTMFGLQIPNEGPFVFAYALGADGYPRLEIR